MRGEDSKVTQGYILRNIIYFARTIFLLTLCLSDELLTLQHILTPTLNTSRSSIKEEETRIYIFIKKDKLK